MNGAQFDCSRKNRRAHENASVPIRVPAEAFRKFQAEMEEYWSQIVARYGSSRRFRVERRRLQREGCQLNPAPDAELE